MAANKTNDNIDMQNNNNNGLFNAFPEPQAWALRWDSAALQASSRPKPPYTKTTPTVRS